VSLFNELAVSIYLYVGLILTDYLDTQITDNDLSKSQFRLQSAWLLSILLISTIALNFLISYGQILLRIFHCLKRLFNRLKPRSSTVVRLQPSLPETQAKIINQLPPAAPSSTMIQESNQLNTEEQKEQQQKSWSERPYREWEGWKHKEEIVRTRKKIMGIEIKEEVPRIETEAFNDLFQMKR
jgi:hypothetical protein